MARRSKPAVKRGRTPAKSLKAAVGELRTLLDFARYAVSEFAAAHLVFAHGTTDPVAEAAFLVCEALHLHPTDSTWLAPGREHPPEDTRSLTWVSQPSALGNPPLNMTTTTPFVPRPSATVEACMVSAPL